VAPNAVSAEPAAPSPIPGAPALLDAGSAFGGGEPTARRPGTAAADDDRLLAQMRAGDEAAFRTLVERHGRQLTRLARMYATDAVAEEVVQETWIAVLRGLDRFEGRSSLRTWMSRILVNIARDHTTREHRQVPFSAFADRADDTGPAVDPDRFRPAGALFAGGWTSFPERWDEQPEQRFLSSEGVSVARLAVDDLPPVQRAVVMLRDIEGWSSEEVAAALGITAGNQRVLLHRGRSRVRAALEVALADRPRIGAPSR
jgi:RNA polymerase sigma-70 factor (ECF subfamily)